LKISKGKVENKVQRERERDRPRERSFKELVKTVPKVMAMMMYNTVHTGPKSHDSGAQDGFNNVLYQLEVSMFILCSSYY